MTMYEQRNLEPWSRSRGFPSIQASLFLKRRFRAGQLIRGSDRRPMKEQYTAFGN